MTRRRKKQISKELAAIASLRDSAIDTSDTPEITDWSQAVVGKFYPAQKTSHTYPASSDAAFTPRQLPNPSLELNESVRTAFADLTPQQLVLECVQGRTEAWQEFIRRFQKLIARVVMRAAREWGNTSPEVIEDLVQDVYVKLAAGNFMLLRKFEALHDYAFGGCLTVTTASVAYNHFRALASQTRGGAMSSTSVELTVDILTESSDFVAEADRRIFLAEIDRILEAIASDRDRTIFRLYYFGGLSFKEIASNPGLKLTVKGIESVIYRLTQTLKRELFNKPSGLQDKNISG